MKHKLFGTVYVKKASEMFRVTAEWLGHFNVEDPVCLVSKLSREWTFNNKSVSHVVITVRAVSEFSVAFTFLSS